MTRRGDSVQSAWPLGLVAVHSVDRIVISVPDIAAADMERIAIAAAVYRDRSRDGARRERRVGRQVDDVVAIVAKDCHR